MPGNDLPVQHVKHSYQKGQGANFSRRAHHFSGEQVEEGGHFRHDFTNSFEGETLFHQSQGGSSSHCIRVLHPLSHLGPGGHGYRKGDKKEHPAHQCGIKDVVAQSAKSHFSDAHSCQGANHDDPDRKVGWQTEGQQQSGQKGRSVQVSGLYLHHIALYQVLKQDAGGNGNRAYDDHPDPEKPDRYSQGRKEGDNHPIHQLRNRLVRVRMG